VSNLNHTTTTTTTVTSSKYPPESPGLESLSGPARACPADSDSESESEPEPKLRQGADSHRDGWKLTRRARDSECHGDTSLDAGPSVTRAWQVPGWPPGH
jgi:hypothetical protein